MITPEVLYLVVHSRKAIFSFAVAVAFRAVNELLVVCRFVVSDYV
jgi:hypothetical protein